MYGITCRAWHHDASNSSNGPPVILPFCFRGFLFSTGFGRVFSGPHGIWLKYRARCGKMWDLLTGYGIWLLPRGSDRDSLKSWGKNGIRERDDRSVGFGFDLTKKWESGIREVTRLSRSLVFPRWGKEQVIFLVMRPFPKMFQTKVCSVVKSL